jgi:hypothetical protein
MKSRRYVSRLVVEFTESWPPAAPVTTRRVYVRR